MKLWFKDRGRLVHSARGLIVEVCSECLESPDTTQQLVTAAQELLENLVKYSGDGQAELDFELVVLEGQPTARIGTQNTASPSHLAEAEQVLRQVIAAPDPVELFDSMVAQSGERHGSGLGLARLRAEAGLALTYAVEDDRLFIEASRAVQPRWSDAWPRG
jgi:hypothetical protein